MAGLGYGFKLFVPSTTRISHRIRAPVFQSRVRQTEKQFSRMFGGETTSYGYGSYLSKRGRLVREKIGFVESFTNRKVFSGAAQKVRSLAAQDARKFRQEAISLETFSPKGRKLFFVSGH